MSDSDLWRAYDVESTGNRSYELLCDEGLVAEVEVDSHGEVTDVRLSDEYDGRLEGLEPRAAYDELLNAARALEREGVDGFLEEAAPGKTREMV